MQNILYTFNVTKIRIAIIEKLKILLKKIKNKKIKTIIKAAITLTKITCVIKT